MTRVGRAAFAAAACLASGATTGARAPVLRPPDEPPLLAPGVRPEKIAGGFEHAEGPLWHPDGYLLFGDTPRDRIVKLQGGDVSVWRAPAGRTTALGFDPAGRLVAAESHGGSEGARRISRQQADGTWVTVADRFEGQRFNSPNDFAIDRRGRIYFTDPRYSQRETMELDHESVYRIDPDGSVTRLTDQLLRPNGILLTADDRTLLVADNPVVTAGRGALWAFDLDAAGAVQHGRVVYDFHSNRGIDGMTEDSAGRIWACAGAGPDAGVYVLALDPTRTTARLIQRVPLPETPTNCTFGGPDRATLYVLSDTSVYALRTQVHGRPTPPGK